MSHNETSWILRSSHYATALCRLKDAVDLARQRRLTKLEELGVIHVFEFTHELAWNTLKDFLQERGVRNLYGSKDTTREAFKTGLIENGEAWMDMIISRNFTSHTYDDATAAKIVSAILNVYYPELEALQAKLVELQGRDIS